MCCCILKRLHNWTSYGLNQLCQLKCGAVPTFKHRYASRLDHTVLRGAGAGLWCFACRRNVLQGIVSVAIGCHGGLAFPAAVPIHTYARGAESMLLASLLNADRRCCGLWFVNGCTPRLRSCCRHGRIPLKKPDNICHGVVGIPDLEAGVTYTVAWRRRHSGTLE
jgi:hypothetical protein